MSVSRLPRPWDSPGKNSGMGCHFLLQCMKVKSEREVAQSCPTLCDPMGCNPPGSSVHGISQARVLEWGAIAFSERRLELGWKLIQARKFKSYWGCFILNVCHGSPGSLQSLHFKGKGKQITEMMSDREFNRGKGRIDDWTDRREKGKHLWLVTLLIHILEHE